MAWTREELAVGASSLAVPVSGADGAVVAAVGLVVPSTRPNMGTGLPVLRATAAVLNALLRERDTLALG